jgi:3-mercaptopyruvate sulfurtransferase SseA
VLYTNGFRNMMILDEGLPGWHAKKYPIAGSPRKG